MSTITPTTTAPVKTSPARARGDASAATSSAASEPEQQRPSVTVTLSDYAQKRMKTMREASAKLRAMQANQQESRKDAARQRLEDIKKRIEMLKQLVMALGPSAAKGALRQIKQLAQELGQAASVLKEPSGGSTASVNAGAAQASSGTREGAQATETAIVVYAASEVLPDVEADPETETAMGSAVATEEPSTEDGDAEGEGDGDERAQLPMERTRNNRDDQQRRADAEELKKVARQLKQLLAMVKAQLSASPDEESKKLIGDIHKQLADIELPVGYIGHL
ncbi:hypothetical protein [Phytopseudomonas daroniae]|uniref:hypothetical protein n=1 Tax=Phytopseudomonas daroniae TaxID=2487519 RepID=UPI0010383F7B|nr:hypothetical protein [Pseudomonas daroniae]TBU73247.1 hypothetical protein DNK10_18390 [Pseudomonas daroniae]